MRGSHSISGEGVVPRATNTSLSSHKCIREMHCITVTDSQVVYSVGLSPTCRHFVVRYYLLIFVISVIDVLCHFRSEIDHSYLESVDVCRRHHLLCDRRIFDDVTVCATDRSVIFFYVCAVLLSLPVQKTTTKSRSSFILLFSNK